MVSLIGNSDAFTSFSIGAPVGGGGGGYVPPPSNTASDNYNSTSGYEANADSNEALMTLIEAIQAKNTDQDTDLLAQNTASNNITTELLAINQLLSDITLTKSAGGTSTYTFSTDIVSIITGYFTHLYYLDHGSLTNVKFEINDIKTANATTSGDLQALINKNSKIVFEDDGFGFTRYRFNSSAVNLPINYSTTLNYLHSDNWTWVNVRDKFDLVDTEINDLKNKNYPYETVNIMLGVGEEETGEQEYIRINKKSYFPNMSVFKKIWIFTGDSNYNNYDDLTEVIRDLLAFKRELISLKINEYIEAPLGEFTMKLTAPETHITSQVCLIDNLYVRNSSGIPEHIVTETIPNILNDYYTKAQLQTYVFAELGNFASVMWNGDPVILQDLINAGINDVNSSIDNALRIATQAKQELDDSITLNAINIAENAGKIVRFGSDALPEASPKPLGYLNTEGGLDTGYLFDNTKFPEYVYGASDETKSYPLLQGLIPAFPKETWENLTYNAWSGSATSAETITPQLFFSATNSSSSNWRSHHDRIGSLTRYSGDDTIHKNLWIWSFRDGPKYKMVGFYLDYSDETGQTFSRILSGGDASRYIDLTGAQGGVDRVINCDDPELSTIISGLWDISIPRNSSQGLDYRTETGVEFVYNGSVPDVEYNRYTLNAKGEWSTIIKDQIEQVTTDLNTIATEKNNFTGVLNMNTGMGSGEIKNVLSINNGGLGSDYNIRIKNNSIRGNLLQIFNNFGNNSGFEPITFDSQGDIECHNCFIKTKDPNSPYSHAQAMSFEDLPFLIEHTKIINPTTKAISKDTVLVFSDNAVVKSSPAPICYVDEDGSISSARLYDTDFNDQVLGVIDPDGDKTNQYSQGLVPASNGETDKYLRADGTWQTIETGIPKFSNITSANRLCITNLADGGTISYINPSSDFIQEGTNNQYFTNERCDSRINVKLANGSVTNIVSQQMQAQVLIANSDIRLKENIKKIEKTDIDKLIPVEYSFKNNPRKRFGFIAQDVEEDIGNLVYTDENGMKGINYQDIISLLVKENQDIKKRIELLEKKYINL